MRIIQTADGARYECYRCGAADGVLWIGLTGRTVAEAAEILGGPDAAREIIDTWDYENAPETAWTGYTELILARKTDEGALVALRKEDAHGDD